MNPKLHLDNEDGWKPTLEGYQHEATGLRLVLNGPVGRWGALTSGGNWAVKCRYKTPERVIDKLRRKSLL
jgi:hypothetical protein